MKTKLIILIFLIGIIIGIGVSPLAGSKPQDFLSPLSTPLAENNDNQVLGESQPVTPSSEKNQNPEETAASLPVSSLKPSSTPREALPQYSNYSGKITVAIFGDSMVDVMDTNLPHLRAELRRFFPKANYYLYNYGVGSQNIEQGRKRVEEAYDYKDRHYPSIVNLNPDVIILDSFAYNPFPKKTEDELYQHWANLAAIVNVLKNKTHAKIIIMADIAPSKEKFGQGSQGINWSVNDAWQQAIKINSYLTNTIKFAKATNLPLIDIYHQTLLPDGEGNLDYISSDDHIHQNFAGNQLIAKNIAEAIYSLNLFK